MYVCQTKNGKTFRNVEYFRLRDDKVEAIECYFGAQSSFPSAVSTVAAGTFTWWPRAREGIDSR